MKNSREQTGNKSMRQDRERNRASVIYFTERGKALGEKIREKLKNARPELSLRMGRMPGQSLQEWCREAFEDSQLLIFVGAAGIAVRAIAPFVRDKFTDPAVLVLDEQGNYVIPILSGHVGGGNRWAAFLAEELPAVPVITTATDLYGKFAVDVFAAGNGLVLSDRRLAKEISGAVLRGKKIEFYCEKPGILLPGQSSGSAAAPVGNFPKDLLWKEWNEAEDGWPEEKNTPETSVPGDGREKPQPERGNYRIYTGIHDFREQEGTLCLFPKAVVIGIGCRKGKSAEEIERFVKKVLKEQRIAPESVCCLASADRKKEEGGILAFAEKYRIPFYTFSAEELAQVPGTFTSSEFVKQTMGIENICERAAVKAAMERSRREYMPALLQKKTAEHGMTLALAEQEWSVVFE